MSSTGVSIKPSPAAEGSAGTVAVAPALARRRGPSPRTVLAIASLGAAVAFVDATIVNIAFPNIERSFTGTPISSLSWVLNAYNIVFAAFLVPAGRRRSPWAPADLRVRPPTVHDRLAAVRGRAVGGRLIVFRVVQALGAALLVPAALGLVLSAFPLDRRAHGVALLSAVAAAAAGLGPSLGGLLVAAGNWRLVFLVNLPIGAAAIVLARRRLVESRASGRRRMPDFPGAVLFALAIAALVLGVVKGEEWGWGSPRIVGSFIVGDRPRHCVHLAVHVASIADRRSIAVADSHVQRGQRDDDRRGCRLLRLHAYQRPVPHRRVALLGAEGRPLAYTGTIRCRSGRRADEQAGAAHRAPAGARRRGADLGAEQSCGSSSGWASSRPFQRVAPGMVLLGIGAGTLFPNLSGAAVASAPGESFATATGLNSVSRQLGAALGVALVVAIIGTPSPLQALAAFDHAWTFGAISLAVAG